MTPVAESGSVGLYTYEELKQLEHERPPFVVEGLIRERSVNLLVGDSGLGKTPLALQLAVAVASGTAFLGRPVQSGKVLYADAESGVFELCRVLEGVSGLAGLDVPPSNVLLSSPNLNAPNFQSPAKSLLAQVLDLRPVLVVIDPLRAYFAAAEEGARDAIEMIQGFRKLTADTGCSWVILHHRRKRNANRFVTLENDRLVWFEEAAGSLAVINGCDTRLGIEETSSRHAALVVAGFVRSIGYIEPIYLDRVLDDEGDPRGYRALTGTDYLSEPYRKAYGELPSRFRFTDARQALGGTSGSNTVQLIRQCVSLGLVNKQGKDYVKRDDT